MAKIKIGVITVAQQLNMVKTVNRQIDIDNGMNLNPHRAHKNKKAYDRKEKRKFEWAE